jgi:undecaprenyl-diphosphatase
LEHDIALYFWNLKDTLIFDVFQIISGGVYIALTSFLFIILATIKLRRKIIIFILAAGIAIAASDTVCYRILKPCFNRPRPVVELNLDGKQDKNQELRSNQYSMPSNHASNIFAFFVIYFFFVRRYWGLFLINSVLISFSRVIIVKHYPGDVLAGIIIGVIIGLLVIFLFSVHGFKTELSNIFKIHKKKT